MSLLHMTCEDMTTCSQYFLGRATLRIKYGSHLSITLQVFRTLPWCHYYLEPPQETSYWNVVVLLQGSTIVWRSISILLYSARQTLYNIDALLGSTLCPRVSWSIYKLVPPREADYFLPSSSRELLPFLVEEVNSPGSLSLMWLFFCLHLLEKAIRCLGTISLSL